MRPRFSRHRAGPLAVGPALDPKMSAVLQLVDTTQAVIHFKPDGTIEHANGNFLRATGYELKDLVGANHRIFVDPAHVASADYAAFWANLRRGKPFTNRVSRITKSGDVIWLHATYGPVFDADGTVISVVKFASLMTDIQTSVTDISAAMAALQDGVLTHRVPVAEDPQLAPLGLSFNSAVERLCAVMGGVTTMASGVLRGAADMTATADDLTRSAQGTQSALSRSTDVLRSLTEATEATAGGAAQIDAAVRSTRDAAEASRVVVDEAIAAMDKIESFSTEISKIIAVIDDISFQTNLLALNAGVEAARAGTAGRGFAVVAEEVRGLARRAAESASQIKRLISDSSSQVGQGAELVRRTGRELASIFEGLNGIAQTAPEIARSARDQNATLCDVSGSLVALSGVSAENLLAVDRSREIAAQLSEEAAHLAKELSGFRTVRGSGYGEDRRAG